MGNLGNSLAIDLGQDLRSRIHDLIWARCAQVAPAIVNCDNAQ